MGISMERTLSREGLLREIGSSASIERKATYDVFNGHQGCRKKDSFTIMEHDHGRIKFDEKDDKFFLECILWERDIYGLRPNARKIGTYNATIKDGSKLVISRGFYGEHQTEYIVSLKK